MRRLFLMLVAAQVLFLAGEAVLYELKLRTGREVVLDVVPYDPRSLLTGHYATLRYSISRVQLRYLPEPPAGPPLQPGETVYAVLRPPSGYASSLIGLSRSLPPQPIPGKVYLRGTVETAFNDEVTIAYGIERYQIPEGREQEVNSMVRGSGGPGSYTGVTVLVAVDSAGRGQLKQMMRYGKPLPY